MRILLKSKIYTVLNINKEAQLLCGIVGFTGAAQAAPILLDGLAKLEYRGYDSAGLAVQNAAGKIEVVKAKGRLKVLSEMTDGGNALYRHLRHRPYRWATIPSRRAFCGQCAPPLLQR